MWEEESQDQSNLLCVAMITLSGLGDDGRIVIRLLVMRGPKDSETVRRISPCSAGQN